MGQLNGILSPTLVPENRYTKTELEIQPNQMKHKQKLDEEVQLWLWYINEWETNHNEPIPVRAELLLENAILELKSFYSKKNRVKLLQGQNHSIH